MTELYGQRVQTTVQTEYLPYVVDTILGSNVMFQARRSRRKKMERANIASAGKSLEEYYRTIVQRYGYLSR